MVLFGPPGSGKGSYCKMFAKDLKLQAFSSGDFFRKRLSKSDQTDPKLKEIEEKITKGGLVEDDLVNQIVHKKLIEAQGKGVILDGYPRTLKQAEYLQKHHSVNIMLNLHLRHDVLVKKLLGRRVCPQCDHAYNIADVNDGDYQMPAILPKKDSQLCDDCNVPLIQRVDDTKDIIEHRQNIYHNESRDIIEFFRAKRLVCEFEPKKGYNDYPQMLNKVVDFFNQHKL